MCPSNVLEEVTQSHLKKEVPSFKVGDTVRVHTRIIEGNKERIQVFMGTVIARKGTGVSETFSVYRNAYGSSMERVFLLHSPRISKVEVVQAGRVRRAKLYYLRGASGKAAKVQQELRMKEIAKEAPVAAPAEEKAPEAAPVEEKPAAEKTVKPAETEEEKKEKLLRTAGKALGAEKKETAPMKVAPKKKDTEKKKEEKDQKEKEEEK